MPTRSSIQRFADQAPTLLRWIDGLADDQLSAHPVPGTWSIRQLVIHILDSDLAASHRMRRIVAEDKPLLVAYDESAFAATPAIVQDDVRAVASLFEAHRRWTAAFLARLPDDAFVRKGIHTQRGTVTLEQMVDIYVDHLRHHEPFLIAKRKALGVPLAH